MAAAVAELDRDVQEVSDDDGIGSGQTSQRSAEKDFKLWKIESFGVPDHLAETRVFPRIKHTKLIEAQPDALHFGGFQLNTEYVLKLNLVNISDKVTRIHILPPQTKFFSVHYRKIDRLVPGLAIKCEVRFTGKEYRYYYDAIRIHGPSEENLTVPLHAYPTLGHQIVPENLRFQSVAVGHSQVKLIPLCNVSPVTFEFRVVVLQPNPCFQISPLDGDIPANGLAHIRVRYAPHDFTTQHCAIQIDTSQFNAKPIVCRLTGISAPGQEREDALKKLDQSQSGVLQSQQPANSETIIEEQLDVTDEDTARKLDSAADQLRDRRRELDLKRRSAARPVDSRMSSASSSSGVTSEDADVTGLNVVRPAREDSRLRKAISKGAKFIVKDGLRIPLKLDNPTAVATVLNQHFQQVKVSELRNVTHETDLDMLNATRQAKATLFDRELQKWNHDERQNQLRWQTRLGYVPMTGKERRETLDFREKAIAHFHLVALREPLADEELERTETSLVPGQRTVRMVDDGPAKALAHFDTFTNSQTESKWRTYYNNLFVQAASRVIVRIRLSKRRTKVVELARAIRTGMQNGQSYEKVLKALFNPEELASPVCDKPPADNVVLLRDARYSVCSQSEVQLETVRSESKPSAPHAPAQPGTTSGASTPRDVRESRSSSMFEKFEQPLRPVQVADALSTLVVRRELPVFEFEVPLHAALMLYSRVDPHEAETTYIPAKCPRSFRSDPSLDIEPVRLDALSNAQHGFANSLQHSSGAQGTAAASVSSGSVPPSRVVTQPASKATDRIHGSLSTIRSESIDTHSPTRSTLRDTQLGATTAMTFTTMGPSQMTQATPMTAFSDNMDRIILTPATLFKPISYHELQVFNTAPGLQVFAGANSYSEIDIDKSLVPIGPEMILISPNTDPKAIKQRPAFVQRGEVVRGALTWKRFSKWGSASNGDVMSAVVGDSEDFFGAPTRYTDRFADELLPTTGLPPVMNGLGDDDRRVIELTVGDQEHAGVSLTPEMINAQFPMIDDVPQVTTSSQLRLAGQTHPAPPTHTQTQTMPLTTIIGSNSTGTMSEKGESSLVGFDKFGRKMREFLSMSRQLQKPSPVNITDVPFY